MFLRSVAGYSAQGRDSVIGSVVSDWIVSEWEYSCDAQFEWNIVESNSR